MQSERYYDAYDSEYDSLVGSDDEDYDLDVWRMINGI